MGLKTYRRKRDFGRTPEPDGGRGRGKDDGGAEILGFVVQKHAASHLHYDFRLELDGVLLSWAVPKGPAEVPGTRRLAMRTEDHPLEYADFEGVIPAGQYGGGTVIVWDRGRWVPLEDPRKGLAAGRLAFRLEGEKLKGEWRLVRTSKGERDKESWLLMKVDEEEARAADQPPLVEARPESS